MEEQEIPELAYTSLFSMAWLDSINKERNGNGRATLEHCLLSADNDIFRVPWDDVVHPEFITRPPKASPLVLENGRVEDTDLNADHAAEPGRGILIDTSIAESAERADSCTAVNILSALEQDNTGRSSATDDSEGEYVELADITLPRFSPQKGSLTQSISMNYRNLHKPRTTRPEQPSTNALESSVKSSRCTQSMVCAILIEENLTEPFLQQKPAGLHRERLEVHESKPTSSKGTAPSNCMPEHEPVPECVPEHLDCINTALCDLKTNNLMHIKNESLNHCLAPDPDSDHPTLSTFTTDLETNAMDEQRIVSRCEPDTNLSDCVTRQDTSKPHAELLAASTSFETSKEDHIEVEDSEKTLAKPKQEDPTDQPVSQPAESENRACGSQCSRESNLSSCDTEEGWPGSASLLGQQVDWAIVSAQPAEGHVTAILPGHERTEPCEKEESENSNKRDVDTEMELPRDEAEGEQATEMQYVNENEAGTEGMEMGTKNYGNTEGAAVDMVEEATTSPTGLVNSTPKSATTVSTPPGQEADSSLGTEGEKQKQARKKKEVEESEEGESMHIESNGAEDVGIMGCPVIENEVTKGIETGCEVFQSPGFMSDMPDANGSTSSKELNIHTVDVLVEGLNISPVVEEMNNRQEERIEEQKLQDEPDTSVSSTQLETGEESHQQQQQQNQEKGRHYFSS